MTVPEAIFDQHIIVLGKTRSGKSSVMRGMVERLLDEKKPVCIVDPKGDWWGLKSSADGKHAGYPVVIFGGLHGDVPLNPRSGATVAELVATENRPCIIDLGGWMPGERTQFWIDFASKFFILTRGRRWLVIDEVHNFCPKGKVMDPNAGKMLHWSNRLASEGLGKGVALVAASQRPQKVHNDFLTSCETLVAMRVIHKADRGAIEDWIDGCGDPEKGTEVVNTLASMKRGEAWVWSPEADFGPKRMQFPMFATYDSFKPQNVDQPAKLKGWADVNLDEVKKRLDTFVKEAEANDPVKLKAKIRELEAAANKGGHSTPSMPTIVGTRALEKAAREQREADEKEFGSILKNRDVAITALQEELRHISKHADTASRLKPFSSHFKLPAIKVSGVEIHERKETDCDGSMATAQSGVRKSLDASHPRPIHESAGVEGTLSKGELVVLKAIGSYREGVERRRLIILTGYKKSSRDIYISRLKGRGLVEEQGQLIVATEAGIDVLGPDFEPLPTGEALVSYWLNRLPYGEKVVFQVVLQHGGNPVVREAIDEATGYKKSSRDIYLSRLFARKIVEQAGRGQVKAAAILFD